MKCPQCIEYETWFRANAALLATHRIGGYYFSAPQHGVEVDSVHGTIAESADRPERKFTCPNDCSPLQRAPHDPSCKFYVHVHNWNMHGECACGETDTFAPAAVAMAKLIR